MTSPHLLKDGVLEDAVLFLTALSLIVGLAEVVRRAGVKWIKTHVVEPLLETRDQVKTNGHTSSPPTLLDTVHTVKDEVGQNGQALEEARDAFHLAARMFDGHITASEADRAALWEAVAELRATTRHAAALPVLITRLEDTLDALTRKGPAPS